ncbi:zinc finger protein 184 [Lingula anatina]|uniref:Zinc finger protein 184 n=1 Tax=Lingula anatina TaxID=7574 RepID=A0A1S3JZ29_LINAN|nr:zinc finger protein 184 [Lingula anatina]|eukprot:XP_013415648.1 zinc finger protein 184 [Lingula anatina]
MADKAGPAHSLGPPPPPPSIPANVGLPPYVQSFTHHGQTLLEQLQRQLQYGAFCDVIVRVEDYDFRLHKCILAAFSQKLQSMLYGMRQECSNVLTLRDVTFNAFRTIIDYVYTGKLKVEPAYAYDVLTAAQYLDMANVEKACVEHLRSLTDRGMAGNPAWNLPPAGFSGYSGRPAGMFAPSAAFPPVTMVTGNSHVAMVNPSQGPSVDTNLIEDYLKVIESFQNNQSEMMNTLGDGTPTAAMATGYNQGHGPGQGQGSRPPAGSRAVASKVQPFSSALDAYTYNLLTTALQKMSEQKAVDQHAAVLGGAASGIETAGGLRMIPSTARQPPPGIIQDRTLASQTEFHPNPEVRDKETSRLIEAIRAENMVPKPVSSQEIHQQQLVEQPSEPREICQLQEEVCQADGQVRQRTLVFDRETATRGPEILSSDDDQEDGFHGNTQQFHASPETDQAAAVTHAIPEPVVEIDQSAPNSHIVSKQPERKDQSTSTSYADHEPQSGMDQSNVISHEVVMSVDQVDQSTAKSNVVIESVAGGDSQGKRKKSKPHKIKIQANNSAEKEQALQKDSTPRTGKDKTSPTGAVGERQRKNDVKGPPKKRKKRKETASTIRCDLCNRTFSRPGLYRRHVRAHERQGGEIYTCHVCHQKYPRPGELTRHLRTHTGELYHCNTCDKNYESQKEFKMHMKQAHDEPKAFQCVFPGCSFKSDKPSNVERHAVIHADLKPYECERCGRTFSQPNGLRSHMQSCFETRSYMCDMCGVSFNHLGSMKSHRRMHTGEKPFICQDCGAGFSDHRNFKRHRRIHDNVFPYGCDICNKKFRHSNSLKSHIKTHNAS